MRTVIQAWPAIMPTKMVHDYVGGRGVWEELMKHYGNGKNAILKPFRRTAKQGNESWHINVVDAVLTRAQMEGTLVNQSDQ
jgi:hypothetical protein